MAIDIGKFISVEADFCFARLLLTFDNLGLFSQIVTIFMVILMIASFVFSVRYFARAKYIIPAELEYGKSKYRHRKHKDKS